MPKTRLNISLDQDLADFAKVFASDNRTSVADVITQYLLALRRRVQVDKEVPILAHPAFRQAMEDVLVRLQDGSAEWHSYEEVFSD